MFFFPPENPSAFFDVATHHAPRYHSVLFFYTHCSSFAREAHHFIILFISILSFACLFLVWSMIPCVRDERYSYANMRRGSVQFQFHLMGISLSNLYRFEIIDMTKSKWRGISIYRRPSRTLILPLATLTPITFSDSRPFYRRQNEAHCRWALPLKPKSINDGYCIVYSFGIKRNERPRPAEESERKRGGKRMREGRIRRDRELLSLVAVIYATQRPFTIDKRIYGLPASPFRR